MAQQNPAAKPMNTSQTELRQGYRAYQITLGTTFVMATISLLLLIVVFANPIWQVMLVSASFAVAWALSGYAACADHLDPGNRMSLSLIGTIIALITVALIVEYQGIPIAIMILIYTIMFAASGLASRQSNSVITLGLGGALLSAFLSSVGDFSRVSFPALQILIPAVLGIMVMLYIVLQAMDYLSTNLRTKFVTSALAISIIPLVLVSFIQSRFVENALQNQTNQALNLAAEQAAAQIDEFLQTNLTLIEREASLPSVINYLDMDPVLRPGSEAERDLARTFESFTTRENAHLFSYGVVNVRGDNIYDMNPDYVGLNERNYSYFAEPVTTGQPYISPITFSFENGDAMIVFSAPVRNAEKQLLGILRVRFDALALQNILEGYSSLLGKHSYPILVDENQVRLADLMTPEFLYQSVVPLPDDQLETLRRQGLAPQTSVEETSTNLADFSAGLQNFEISPYFGAEMHPGDAGHPESGAIVALENQTWYMVFAQEQTALTALLTGQTRLSTLIATLLAGAIGVAATLFSRLLSNPIVELQETADSIASGNLESQAKIESDDEIGALGRAFNMMTAQLRGFIANLEDRVRERTAELARQNDKLIYRSNQLQTVSDVARDVAAAQELETLLSNVCRLISDRFGFYHVGIFLVDDTGENAVLRAANSSGGQRMLARRHTLKVGQVGIVGYATGEGQARIATDVGQDAVFFNNPDLPLTRSEMALPLKSAGRVIGALDVQSQESNAFTEEDVNLFGILADQIAIAIQNNRLYANTAQALEEAKEVHRRYLEQQWTSEVEDHPRRAFRYLRGSLLSEDAQSDETSKRALERGDVVVTTTADQETHLAVPIMLRGSPIGVIRIQETSAQARRWSEEELGTVQAVADQVAQALENARLFEQTVRRAERERRVYEITSKIRATNDPQQMISVALQELQSTLKTSKAQIILQPEDLEIPSNDDIQESQPEAARERGGK